MSVLVLYLFRKYNNIMHKIPYDFGPEVYSTSNFRYETNMPELQELLYEECHDSKLQAFVTILVKQNLRIYV